MPYGKRLDEQPSFRRRRGARAPRGRMALCTRARERSQLRGFLLFVGRPRRLSEALAAPAMASRLPWGREHYARGRGNRPLRPRVAACAKWLLKVSGAPMVSSATDCSTERRDVMATGAPSRSIAKSLVGQKALVTGA